MPWQWPWRRTQDRDLFNIGNVPVASSWAGEPVTVETALRLSTVWGCVRLLADSVSTLPLHVYRGDDRDPIPTPPLLGRPSADHPELSDWLWAVMASLLLRGNCWGVITARAGAGLLPAQVDLVHPDHVSVTETRDAPPVIRIGGEEQDRADLFHVKAYPLPGSIEGLSPIAYARESIGLGRGAERYGAKFFGDSAIPSGVITTEQRVTREQATELKEYWKLAHQGRREIAVLGGGARFQAVTIAPEEAQFIETSKANVATIARYFGVPPTMLGGPTGGHEDYSSPEMRSTELLTFTLRPWLHRVERAVSGLLPRNQTARFNPGALVRATLLDRYQAHESGIRAGWLLRSEVRELEDRPPIPGIDDRPPPQAGVA
jgi:HK97 family phage portal protein